MAEPPAKRYCSQQDRQGFQSAVPGNSGNARIALFDDDDELLLTQDQLNDLDRQVEAEVSKKTKHSQSTVVLSEEKVKRGAPLLLRSEESALADEGPSSSYGVSKSVEQTLLARVSVETEEFLKLQSETEGIKQKLLKNEKELIAKDGELKILRIRQAENDREKNKIRSESGQALLQQKAQFEQQLKQNSAKIRELEDQLKFLENEKRDLELKVNKLQEDLKASKSMVSSSSEIPGASTTIPPPKQPSSSPRATFTPTISHRGNRHRPSRGSLGPDKRNFYEVPASQNMASSQISLEPSISNEGANRQDSSSSESEEEKWILDTLDDAEILARITGEMRHASLGWTEYEEFRQNRTSLSMGRTLGNCFES